LERAVIPRVLTPATTVAELLYLFAEQPQPQRCYAVVRVADDAYVVLALDDLNQIVAEQGQALLAMPLRSVENLLRAAPPLWQSQIGPEAANRAKHQAPRRRVVVLDDSSAVAGVLVTTMFGTSRDLRSSLDLINGTSTEELDGEPLAAPPAPPHLNTRFDGVAPNAPLTVGRRVPLIVSVGAPTATNNAQSSRPFAFTFEGVADAVRFLVTVDGDPAKWTIRALEPELVVAPPGTTKQEAEFVVTALQPGRDKLIVSVERDGALVQKIWLQVDAALEASVAPLAPVVQPIAVSLPIDAAGLTRSAVELTVQPDVESSLLVVRADLPGGMVRKTYRVPVSSQAIQDATLRLRQELEKIVYYIDPATNTAPFANANTLTVAPDLARRACVPLADAGWQVWDLLFNSPRVDAGLKQLAADLRALPHGSNLRVVLDSQEFIVPWALLYDAPGEITEQTLVWDGFWGYRYILDVMPPGRYPAPEIVDSPPGLLLLFNDDQQLRRYTTVQEQFARTTFAGADATAAWGEEQVKQELRTPPSATLIYSYCHANHQSGAVANPKRGVVALASESALCFSPSRHMRLADLRRLPAGPLNTHPLIFVNACEGAAQDAFYYDGFMPFFIEQQGARGFIGTEVKAPQLLGHEFGQRFLTLFASGQPVGEILWQLRREYLEQHGTILAFNYSLYCHSGVRLAKPFMARAGASATQDIGLTEIENPVFSALCGSIFVACRVIGCQNELHVHRSRGDLVWLQCHTVDLGRRPRAAHECGDWRRSRRGGAQRRRGG
jgi:CHAT domain